MKGKIAYKFDFENIPLAKGNTDLAGLKKLIKEVEKKLG